MLTVSLTDDQRQEQRYIVDVGLVDMPYEPLPLQHGTYEQGPFRFRVETSVVAQGGWRIVHDPPASFVGVDVAQDIAEDLESFRPKHEFFSRSPESPWIKLFLVHLVSYSKLERDEIWNRVWRYHEEWKKTKRD